jgi:hypothetical protein
MTTYTLANLTDLTGALTPLSIVLSGGGGSGTVALQVGNSGAAYTKGITLVTNALDPSVGAGGNGVALEMFTGQSIRWRDGSAVVQGEIFATSSGLAIQGAVATANGIVATTMTSLGPAGSHTTVQEWLTITTHSGTTRYIPCY